MFYPRPPLFLRFSQNVFAFLRGTVRLDLLALATTIRPPLTESALCTLCLTTSLDGIGAYALRLCSGLLDRGEAAFGV